MFFSPEFGSTIICKKTSNDFAINLAHRLWQYSLFFETVCIVYNYNILPESYVSNFGHSYVFTEVSNHNSAGNMPLTYVLYLLRTSY